MRTFRRDLSAVVLLLLAPGVAASAKPPDNSFIRFDQGMSGAPGSDEIPNRPIHPPGTTDGGDTLFSGADYSGRQTITIKIPPNKIVDASYNQGTVACRGSRRNQHSVSTTVPSGVYVEVSGHDGRCSVSNIALTETFDEGTHALNGYSLAADLSCSGICNVSLNAWIKLRPRVPSDAAVEPSSNSAANRTSGPETPRAGILATGIPTSAKPPDKSFSKFSQTMFVRLIPPDIPTQPFRRNSAPDQWSTEAPGTVFDSLGTITVKVQPGAIIDTSYKEGNVTCRQSSKNQLSAPISVPAGIYIEIKGRGPGCWLHGIAVGTVFNAKTHELSEYTLSAYLSCGDDCGVSLKAWIKLRPRVPSDVVVEPPSNPTTTGTLGPETPRGAVLSQKGLFAYVSRNDLGSQIRLNVTFVAPQPVAGAPAPYDRIQFYCYRRLANNQPVSQFLPYATCPDIHGTWKPGESVKFTVDVPKEYSDPTTGWKVRFAICKTGKACVEASPNLLEMKPAPQG